MGATMGPAWAAYVDDVGFAALQAELSVAPPDGSGLAVMLIEACTGDPCAWAPNPGGRSITDGDGVSSVVEPFSGHATGVGNKFYGDPSTTPGIGVFPSPSIAAYEAGDWMTTGFLRTGQYGADPSSLPKVTPSRIGNHSWVGSSSSDVADLEALHRIDWLVETDEFIQVVGFTGDSSPLLGSAFNIIAVNRTGSPTNNGAHTVAGDAAYAAERTRPDLVAPDASTSAATPRVASAAALLMDTAQSTPSLSNGSTTNRNGTIILNAERTEVIKASLMAGADRATSNTFPASDPVDISGYRISTADQTNNGLDRRYGAGQLNIYNSYQAIAAGEQDSLEDNGSGVIGAFGFDYDPAFGGQGGNSEATYFFSADADAVELTASLVWNIAIAPGLSSRFDQAATLYDLDLSLYEVIDPGDSGTWVLIRNSASTSENTENIWVPLVPGKNYALQVTAGVSQAPFNWDYGLAWQIMVVAEVPNIIGQAQATAEANIIAAGLTIGVVTMADSDTVPAGAVISQNPTACTACLIPGVPVDLTVSSGSPASIVVPDVVDLPRADAETTIINAGLMVGDVTSSFSETVPVGNVVSQTPATGVLLANGTAINLIISDGKLMPPIDVPDIVGQTEADAAAAITSTGLEVGVITTQSNNTVPTGIVISQTPMACTSCINSGDPVNMVLSSGPPSGGGGGGGAVGPFGLGGLMFLLPWFQHRRESRVHQ
jgi:hypothetical protein